jgi:MinD superfamily P-loop ATPase
MDALTQYVHAGLELAGEQADDVDLAVIRAADGVYGPAMRALDAADLTAVYPEPTLDPGRAPRPL